MSKEEEDAEEFLEKLARLRTQLPYEEYKTIEDQLPYGLKEEAQELRRARRKKQWLIRIFVLIPLCILFILLFPKLVLFGIVCLVLEWVWRDILGPFFKPPSFRR
jgi:hypothetical protein